MSNENFNPVKMNAKKLVERLNTIIENDFAHKAKGDNSLETCKFQIELGITELQRKNANKFACITVVISVLALIISSFALIKSTNCLIMGESPPIQEYR